MKAKISLILLCICAAASCYDPHARESAIVRQIEAAGSGDISTFSEPGLVKWFGAHQEFAKQITRECIPLAQNKPASWIMTAEGTACHSASLAATWSPSPLVADQRSW
ncbi:MAG: hypothetical protein WB992_03580 [Bryobacteraceae bacterium]